MCKTWVIPDPAPDIISFWCHVTLLIHKVIATKWTTPWECEISEGPVFAHAGNVDYTIWQSRCVSKAAAKGTDLFATIQCKKDNRVSAKQLNLATWIHTGNGFESNTIHMLAVSTWFCSLLFNSKVWYKSYLNVSRKEQFKTTFYVW